MVKRLRIQQAAFLEWLQRTHPTSLSINHQWLVFKALQSGTYLNNNRDTEGLNFLRAIYLDEYKNSLL